MRTFRIALVAVVLAAVGVAGTAGAAALITGKDIKNGSIGAKDLSKAAKRALKGQTGPQGPAGAPGATGPQGPAGKPGPSSLATSVITDEFFAPANDFAEGEVRCPAGMVAIGGSVSPGALYPVMDIPSQDGRGWFGVAVEVDGASDSSMLVSVICTRGSATVAPLPFAVSSVEELKSDARARIG
jgi:hypothetical protein